MGNNVEGLTEVNISYCNLLLIVEVQLPVIERLLQIGTGGPTSSKIMLCWMDNIIYSKMVTYFVDYYTFK